MINQVDIQMMKMGIECELSGLEDILISAAEIPLFVMISSYLGILQLFLGIQGPFERFRREYCASSELNSIRTMYRHF